jgi:ribosomal protein S18 acetylase RimI-like enzyme
MSSGELETVRIVPPRSDEERRIAARLLSSRESAETRNLTCRRLLERGPRDGWFLACSAGRAVGAVLADQLAGRAGAIWPPCVVLDDPLPRRSVADQLLARAIEYLRAHGSAIVQAQLENQAGEEAQALRAAGFEPFCELMYLSSEASDFPTAPPAPRVRFEHYSRANHARLVRLVEETYRDTLDCPRLNGLRDVEDVLEGYQALGHFAPERWLIVLHEGRDVGCLLLTTYCDPPIWELIYQGIVPWARGRGLGTDVTRHAQWLAAQAGAEQLVLAVDAANDPALAVYAAAGFRAWESRWVFARLLSDEKRTRAA